MSKRGRKPRTTVSPSPSLRTLGRASKSKSKERKSQQREVREQIRTSVADFDLESEHETIVSTNMAELDEMLKEMEKVSDEAKEVRTEGAKPWVEVIIGNRELRRGTSMEFSGPKILDGEHVAQISLEDIESEVDHWKTSLILFAVGKELSMNVMQQFMELCFST